MKNLINHTDIFKKKSEELNSFRINSWDDISSVLTGFDKNKQISGSEKTDLNYLKTIESGIAFITFDYGIDGVSIEIEKYALCLEKLFKEKNGTDIPLHFIGGDFHDKADAVLKERWKSTRNFQGQHRLVSLREG